MAVKVITLDGKGTVKISDGKGGTVEKDINFKYPKIVTPGTKRNAGTEAEQKEATFFTFAEIAAFLGGNVEFKLKADGTLDETAPTSICQYILDGWNAEKNREAKDAQINTPAVERAKVRATLNEMRAKLVKVGMKTTELDTMLAELDALDKAEDEGKETADKKEAAETRQARNPKGKKA